MYGNHGDIKKKKIISMVDILMISAIKTEIFVAIKCHNDKAMGHAVCIKFHKIKLHKKSTTTCRVIYHFYPT